MSDVSPRFPVYDLKYLLSRHSILTPKFCEASSETLLFNSNFFNCLLGKDGVSNTIAPRRAMATFLDHIGDVFSLRSKKQMRGVYAAWIVATMTNAISMISVAFRNRTIVNLPGNAMGTQASHTASAGNATVAVFATCAAPFPAIIDAFNIDELPKTLRKRHSLLSHFASPQCGWLVASPALNTWRGHVPFGILA